MASHTHTFSEPEPPREWLIHAEGDPKCEHDFQSKYIGLGFWGVECRKCNRLQEEKIPGYNCPEEQARPVNF
jgi:hypothetical protein